MAVSELHKLLAKDRTRPTWDGFLVPKEKLITDQAPKPEYWHYVPVAVAVAFNKEHLATVNLKPKELVSVMHSVVCPQHSEFITNIGSFDMAVSKAAQAKGVWGPPLIELIKEAKMPIFEYLRLIRN